MATRARPQPPARSADQIFATRPLAATPHEIEPRTIDQIGVPNAVFLLVGTSIAVSGVLLYLTRQFNFFSDEWTFILSSPQWGVKSYFEPHGEHWVTLLMAWYKLVFTLFGATNYQVFMAGVLGANVLAAVLLFLVIRKRSGDVLGLAAAGILLVLGSGWEEILWAFQIGWAMCVIFGLSAVLLLRSEHAGVWRMALASAALLLSVASSGPGLFFLALVGVDLLFSPSRRRGLTVLVAPVVAYLVWFAAIGHSGLSTQRSPIAKEAFLQLFEFIPTGIGGAFSGMFGPASRGSFVAIVVVSAALAIRWYQRRWKVDSLVLGAVVALICEYALIGLVRGQFGDLAATTSRYVWMGALFGLLILTDAARGMPWNRITKASLLAVVVVSVGLNGLHLRQEIAAQNAFFASQNAELQVTWMVRDAPSLDREGIIPIRMAGPGTPPVTVGGYIDSRRVLGSGLVPIQPSDLGYLDPASVNLGFANALPASSHLVDDTGQAGVGACIVTDASGVVETQVPDRGVLLVSPSSPGPITVTVWYEGSASGIPGTTTVVRAGQSLEMILPDSGLGLSWHVRVSVPAYLSARICSNAA